MLSGILTCLTWLNLSGYPRRGMMINLNELWIKQLLMIWLPGFYGPIGSVTSSERPSSAWWRKKQNKTVRWLSVNGRVKDKIDTKFMEVSVISGMKNKKVTGLDERVRHRWHEGQRVTYKHKNCPSASLMATKDLSRIYFLPFWSLTFPPGYLEVKWVAIPPLHFLRTMSQLSRLSGNRYSFYRFICLL